MKLVTNINYANTDLPHSKDGDCSFVAYSLLLMLWLKAKEYFLSVKVQSHC